MTDAHVFLQDLAIVLCVAAVTTVVFQWLRQPVVLGYLLAGLIVGPYITVSPTADPATIRTLSELGVILLMFSIGLEFSLQRLMRVGPTVALVAAVEIGLMLTLGVLTADLLGWGTLDSLVAGMVVAVSSTMIIAKVFVERRIGGRLAELVFGVLITEDLVAILLIAALAAVAAGNGLSAAALGGAAFRLIVFLGVVLALGLLAVPRAIRAIVRLHRPETTLVATIGLSFAAALIAQAAGYSVALGAFLAGSLVAESGATPVVEPLVRPVRDMFAAIFFVSVGMLIDPALILEHWSAVAALTAVVLIGKTLGVSTGAFLTGHGIRTSVRAGMSMAQIGEFSFIIAGIGIQLGAGSEFLYPVTVAVSVVTAFTTPFMIRYAEPVALYVDRRLPRPLQTVATLYGSWIELLRTPGPRTTWARVKRMVRLVLLDAGVLAVLIIAVAVNLRRLIEIIVGFTTFDPPTARWLVIGGAAVLASPFCIGIAGLARRLGFTLAELALPAPGAGRVDPGLAPRRVLTVILQIAIVMAVGLPLLAVTQPFLPPFRGPAVVLIALAVLGVAFWRSATNLQGHMRAGAQIVVEALAPGPAAATGIASEADQVSLEAVEQMLPGLGSLVPVRIGTGSDAAGRSLAELNVRGRTGATAVALLRGTERVVFPTAKEVLRAGDIVALSGSHDAIDAATELLTAAGQEQALPVETRQG